MLVQADLRACLVGEKGHMITMAYDPNDYERLYRIDD